MTHYPSLFVLLLFLVLSSAITALDPPLSRSGVKSNSKELQADSNVRPRQVSQSSGEVSIQSVLRQVTRGAFPASLWATLPSLPQAHHVSTQAHLHNYTLLQEDVRNRLWPVFNYYMPDTSNVSRSCKMDVEAFYVGVFRGTGWAVSMVDSWGKIPDGLLEGNTWVPGMLDECLAIKADQELPQTHFKGQYCAVGYVAKENTTKQATTMEPTLRIGAITGSTGVVISGSLYGTCIPSTCTKEEYEHSLVVHLERHGLELGTLLCQTEDLPTMQYGTTDVMMIVVLSVLGMVVVAGTGTDIWVTLTGRTHQDTGHLRYILVFSFYTNLKKIFHINVKENDEVISCLHGIRVLTMCWVVLGHNYLVSLTTILNKVSLLKSIIDNPAQYQIIMNGLPSVDTFFVMSGLLVSYNLTKEFNKTQKFNIPVYYIHRFIRLAPPILMLCGFIAVFLPLFARGVFSPLLVQPEEGLVDLCRRYWWRDSFFLTNWFSNGMDAASCIPVCWYTATDFQLYIVTPLMFLPILYRRKPGAVWLACLVVASAVIPAVITGVYKLPPTSIFNTPLDKLLFFSKWVYMMPWCRASPYLMGLILGYYLRVMDKNVQLTWWQAVLGWVVALAIMTAVVFGMTDYNTPLKVHEYNAAISILYGGLHALAWGVAVAWMIFACHLGYGGPINSFLSHPYWQPLSRLTYTIFLIALNVQIIVYYSMATVPTYFTNLNEVMVTLSVLMFSGFCAVILSLLTESPVLGLEKLLLRKAK